MSTLARKVIGAHAFFARDGVAFLLPAPGTISRTAKPGPTDTKWIDLGEGDWTPSPNSKTVDFMAPAPGARVLKDKITTARGLKYKGKLFEIQNLSWQLIMGSLDLPTSPTAGGQYNPLEGEHNIKGWLKLQQYGQDNSIINVVDVYVAMQISGDVAMGENPVDIDVEADVLYSTLNTGTLS
jgi:hypothetical protein